jgi:transposase
VVLVAEVGSRLDTGGLRPPPVAVVVCVLGDRDAPAVGMVGGPGDNVRRHLAVSMLAGSGRLIVSQPKTKTRRDSDQFLAHLRDLCRRLRRWKVIHVICDNAVFHKSRRVQDWVAKQGGLLVVHFLPTRAPEENPVERVFWRLHEAVTRNHRFESIDELVKASVRWMEEEGVARVPRVEDNVAA